MRTPGAVRHLFVRDEGQAEVNRSTAEQQEQYVAAAPDALEKRLRLLEVGMLRHTALLETIAQALEKLVGKR